MKPSNTPDLSPKMRAARRRFIRTGREEGSTLFEFALILPLLSMLLVGIILGGVTFYDYVTLAEAVAVGGGPWPPMPAFQALARRRQPRSRTRATSLKTSAVTVSISFPSTNTHSDSCTTIYGGDSAMVNATYPCNMTIPFTKVNLCPVSGPSSTKNSAGVTTMSCPYTSCISSTTTVVIE